MDINNLIKMANQIGAFFEAMPDRVEALEGIASHIKKFWEPRMRSALLTHWQTHHGEGLLPIVNDAMNKFGQTLR